MKNKNIKIKQMIALLAFSVLVCCLSCSTSSTITATKITPTITQTISPIPTPTPRNFLLDPACDPPCWEGIIPGVTTKDDAMAILRQNELVLPNSIELYNEHEKEAVQFKWTNRLHGMGFIMFDDQEKVWEITLPVFMTMSLDTAFKRYGEPDSISIIDYNNKRIVEFYYPDQGIGFTISLYSDSQIKPTSVLTLIFYFDPNNKNDLKCHSFGCTALHGELIPWKGYGSIWEDDNNK